jgi:hypothetical protein
VTPPDQNKEKPSKRPKRPAKGTSPTARRQQKRREEKLRLVREQVEEGSLTIRKMTPEERKKFPPRDKGKGKDKRK